LKELPELQKPLFRVTREPVSETIVFFADLREIKLKRRNTVKPSKNNDVLGTTNRGNPAESGLCTLCRADCAGKCETWLSSLIGRQALYLGYTELSAFDQVRHDFKTSVDYLRSLGFKGVTLKTGAYGMEALAMAIKLAEKKRVYGREQY
jgi:hypothetical protein